MARSWRIRFAGAKYHVTVRGNARQEVFHSDEYYGRSIKQLMEALEKDEVVLYLFVLMPNHYQVFVQTPHANIQRFMQRLNTSYSMHHRYRHQSPGDCFQGRYGAKLVEGDQYILALTRYIHLNPVKVAEYGKANREQKLAELLAADRGLQQQMAALTKTLGKDGFLFSRSDPECAFLTERFP